MIQKVLALRKMILRGLELAVENKGYGGCLCSGHPLGPCLPLVTSWVLLFVLLEIPTGFTRYTPLEHYTTQTECESERDRIATEMASAYPGEDDYKLVCAQENVVERANPREAA